MLESDPKLGYINNKKELTQFQCSGSLFEDSQAFNLHEMCIHLSRFFFCDKRLYWFFNSFVDYIFMNGTLLHNSIFLMYSSWVIRLQSADLAAKKKPITTIAFNCVIFEIIFFFGCRYRYCYCSHCFSCNNNIFHFRFMSIHIGIIEHKRDLRELQYLHGMKKRQRRWIAVFWIFFFSNYDVWWTVLMGEGGGRRCAKKDQQMNLRRFYMAKRSRARFHTWLTTVWMD